MATTTTLDSDCSEVDLMNIQEPTVQHLVLVLLRSGSGAIIAAYDGASEVFRIADGGTVTITTAANAASPASSGDNLVIKDSGLVDKVLFLITDLISSH